MLASAAWLARSYAALAALDHVPRLISDYLDVSRLLTPPQAAAVGVVSLFQRVLKRVDATGVDPVLRFHWLGHALLKAIERGHLSVVQYIHDIHPAPLAVLSFEAAAAAGRLDILQWLTAHRFDRLCIDIPPARHDPPSMKCCFSYQCEGAARRNKQFHILRWLYETGYVTDLEGVGDEAAAVGDLEMVTWLHKHVDDRSVFSNGAIDGAARQGHLAIVQFLHKNRHEGALVTTLMGTMAAGHTEVVEYLQKHRISTVISPETILQMACRSGRIELLEEFSAFLDSDHTREEALDVAVASGHLQVARWLGKRPVSSDALSKAAMDGHLEVLQWVHEQECGAWIPEVIAKAAGAGHLAVIQWANEQRPDLLTTLVMGCAAAAGHLEILQWMDAHCSAICSSDAMDEAAANGHLTVVQWLHEQGVEYTTNCMDGAAQHGHLEVLMWLHDHGYDRISPNAMRSGALDVVMWLHDRFELPIDPGAVIRSIALGDLMFMKWIHANTGVTVSPRLVQIVLPMGHPHMLEWMRDNRPTEFVPVQGGAEERDEW